MPNQLVNYYRATFPEAAAGLSDDEITLKYGTAAEDFKSKGTDLFQTYPDFAADFERIRKQKIADTLTVGDYLKQAAGQFAGSAVGVLGSVPETAAKLTRKLTGGVIDVVGPTERAIESTVEAVTPDVDEAKREVLNESFLASKVPGGIGSAAAFLAGGGAIGGAARAAKLATAASAATTGVGVMGVSSGFNEQYKRALKETGDEGTAFRAGLLGAGVGATEIVPLGRFLDRLMRVAPSAKVGISKMLREGTKESFEETVQEAFQSGAGDAIAGQILAYDPDLKMFEGLADDAAAGGATGLLFSLLTQSVARVRNRTVGQGEGKQKAGPNAPDDTLKVGERPVDAAAPPETAPGIDILQAQHDVNMKGLNDLLARELAEGSEAVAAEKAALSADENRLYAAKLRAALVARLREQRQAAERAAQAKAGAARGTPEAPPGVVPETPPTPAAAEPEPRVTPPPAAAAAPAAAAPAAPTPQAPPAEDARPPTDDELAAFEAKYGYRPSVPTVAELRKAEDILAGRAPSPAAQPEPQTPTPDAIREPATTEVGVGDQAAVPPGVGVEDQGQAAQMGEQVPPEGEVAPPSPAPATGEAPPEEPPAAAPGAPVVPPEVAAVRNRIAESSRAFAAANTGEDSRAYIVEGLKAISDQAQRFGEMRKVLADAKRRYDEEVAATKQPATGKRVEVPLLREEEIAALDRLDSKSAQSAKVGVLLAKLKAGEATRRTIDRYEETLAGLQADALTRLDRAQAKSGAIGKPGQSLTADQLLGWEQINYAPQDGSPGVFVEADGTIQASEMSRLARAYDRAGADREKVAFQIGDLLAKGGRVAASRSATKRLAVWQAPDGSVLVTSAYNQAQGKKGKEVKANSAWRYATGAVNAAKARQGDDIGGGKTGIVTLLNAGYRPIGSIATLTPRGQVTLVFPSVAAFDNAIGEAARTQQQATRSRFATFEQTGAVDVPETQIPGENLAELVEAKDVVGREAGDVGIESIAAEETVAPTEEEEAAAEAKEEARKQARQTISWIQQNADLATQIVDFYFENEDGTWRDAAQKFFPQIVARLDPAKIDEALQKEFLAAVEETFAAFEKNPAALNEFTRLIQNELGTEAPTVAGVPTGPPAGVQQDAGGGVGGGVVSGEAAQEGGEEAPAGQPEAGGGAVPDTSPAAVAAQVEEIETQTAPLTSKQLKALDSIESLRKNRVISAATADKLAQALRDAKTEEEQQLIIDYVNTEAAAILEDARAEEDTEPDYDGDDDQEDSYRLMPDTPDNAAHNIIRLLKTPKPPMSGNGINGVISEAALRDTYPSLTDALGVIQREEAPSAGSETPVIDGRTINSIIAEAFSQNAILTGATLNFVNDADLRANLVDPKTGQRTTSRLAADYNLVSGAIRINLACCRDVSDLHQSILHETTHAFVDRTILRYYNTPDVLTSDERSAVDRLTMLMTSAEQAGLKWQQSDGSNPQVKLREFVAAAVSNPNFQRSLAAVENRITATAPGSLWQGFIKAIADLIASISKAVFGTQASDTVREQNVLAATVEAVTGLVRNYNEQTAFADKLIASAVFYSRSAGADATNAVKPVSYRIVEGMFKDRRDVSVDLGNTALAVKEGQRMMATTNEIDAALARALRVWQAAGGGVGRTQNQFTTDFINSLLGGRMQTADDVRREINRALAAGLAPTVPITTTLADLDQQGEALKAAKDAHSGLRRVEDALVRQNRLAEAAFARGTVLARLQQSNADLFDLTRNYTDLTRTQAAFVRELRQAINQTGDTGAYHIARTLGVPNPKADVDAAVTRIQGNIQGYTDALTGLADLGLDFGQMRSGNLTPAQVNAAVQASQDPRLAALRGSAADLSVALMFARKRPIVMNLLAARGAGAERAVLDNIISLATQNRPTAFQDAQALLPRLTTLGRVGQRIIDNIREERAINDRLLARATRYSEVIDFVNTALPQLRADIRRLERMLGMERGASNRQWSAIEGARYFVPASPTAAEEEVFVASPANPGYRTLRLGDQFNATQIQRDIAAMQAWLAANRAAAGSANYQLLERQVDRLLAVYANNANYQIQRGPGGLIVSLVGDIATRCEFTGTQAGRVVGQAVRRFNTLYDAFLKGPEQREFLTFDRLRNTAQKACNVYGKDFDVRFYNRAFGFLEARPDLIDARLSPDQQTQRSIDAAMTYLSNDPALQRSGASDAVRALLVQGVLCNNITQRKRQQMGLKVREESHGGRWIFREPIGVPAHTMSRGISSDIRTLVSGEMAAPWRGELAPGVTSLRANTVTDLYTNNRAVLDTALRERFTPRVLELFARPLCEKEGESNFFAPEFSGVRDKAQRANVIDAFNQSAGDMIRFAEILNDLEGGSPQTRAAFVGQTLATFEKYFSIISAVNGVVQSQALDDGAVMSRSFLDARQGEDFPDQWLEYRQFGEQDNVRYTRMFALQAAFGQDASAVGANIDKMIAELEVLQGEYERAMKLSGKDNAERDRILDAGGLRKARQNAAKNKAAAVRIKKDFADLVKTMNGVPQEYGILMRLVGLLSGYTVQGIATAFTDTVSLIESIYRRFGFSREAVAFITNNGKYLTLEALQSLFQAIGLQLNFNNEYRTTTELLNQSGLVDQDALVQERFLNAFARRYEELTAAEESYRAVINRTQGMPVQRAAGLVRSTAERLAVVARIGLETGIGRARDPRQAAVTLKLQAPFTWVNQIMHRAVARSWLSVVNDATRKAADYMRAHPQAAADPAFRFTSPSQIEYSGRGLVGVSLDSKNFEYLYETLQRNGISLEEAARRQLRGEPALTEEQVHAVVSMAQTEILLNSSTVTRPTWSINSTIGRLSSPIIGWGLYKMTDLIKTTRNARNQAEVNAFKQALIAFAFGVLPASLAYAFLRDEYDEEVLGKKPNVLPLRADSSLPLALMDNLARVGTFGAAGDLANSVFNVSTAREFSIDQRVFFLSSLRNIANIVGTLYRQEGTATYDTVWRPFLQSVGGAGYLNNFDAINNILDFDNSERRTIRRINVNNQLRAAGRVMELDVRTSRGMQAVPNPVKPWVGQMVTAAYANDPASFREAYTKAVEAATKMAIDNETPKADPKADVAEAFQRMHPLRSVFSKSPTRAEYQRLLMQMGDGSQEVAAAIRNFNAYGAQIPRGRGKEGITPFYGTERSEGRRASTLPTFGPPRIPGLRPPTYRSLIAEF